MAASRKSPQDATGRKAEELAEKRAQELAARAAEISTINPIPEIVDYTKPKPEEPEPEPQSGIVSSGGVKVKSKADRKVKMQVNTDLEETTIGKGNVYTFKRGQTYLVPEHVYEHLERLGYVYH